MNIRQPVLVALALLFSGTAQAEWSANLGFASDYYYRGIFQAESSPSGGLDFEKDGFYAGTWLADVEDGLEVDGYFGYGKTIDAVTYSVGYTGYFYTGDFDDTYQELNLGAAAGLFSLDIAVGNYDNFAGPKLNYGYVALTVEKDGFYGRYAGFSQDFTGNYFEAGYATTVAEIEFGVTLIISDKDLSGVGETDEALIFTVGKSFDLSQETSR